MTMIHVERITGPVSTDTVVTCKAQEIVCDVDDAATASTCTLTFNEELSRSSMTSDSSASSVVSVATARTTQTVTTMSSFFPVQLPSLPTSPQIHAKRWNRIAMDLRKIVTDECALSLLRSLYDAAIPPRVIKALALLSKPTLPHAVRDNCMDEMALFLTSPKQHSKLACIRSLMVLCSPVESSWQLEEGCLKETLHFLTDRTHDWFFPEHSEQFLLWELRAKCLCMQKLSETEHRLKVEHVVRGSEVVAEYMAGAAKWVERGLKWSASHVEGGLETAGDSIKSVLTPSVVNVSTVPTSCSGAAKRASGEVRETTRRTVHGIRDGATNGIHKAAQSAGPSLQRIVTKQEHRDVLCAAGAVGIAGVGAMAIVAEAIFESTRAVAQKTASVTADVVRHKYGDAAGQVVQDASDTADNICRTLAHVAMLKVVIKSAANNAAKSAGKNKVRGMHKDEDGKDLDTLLDTTKADALAVVHKLQRRKQNNVFV